jgi:phosphonate transport system substrate-binding protein
MERSRFAKGPIAPFIRVLIAISFGLLFALVSGCAKQVPNDVIDLSNLQELPQNGDAQITPLRLAVANVISPEGTLESYEKLLTYLGNELGRPIELVQRRTYAETNDLVRNGEVDLAFVCTSAYVVGKEEFGMQLLVAPIVNGEAVYYSELIVPAESNADTMEDLEGAVFAFTDPMSNSGRVYPTSVILGMGETPETFFSRTFFTYSHDQAILAVANGLADGAAVDSLVLDYALRRDPSLVDKLRVIHRSPAFGIPPVVVSSSISPQLFVDLQDLLLQVHLDQDGREALDELDIDQFVVIDDSAYDTVRALVDTTNKIVTDNP